MGDNVPPCIQSRHDMLAKLLGVTTTSGNPCYIGMREMTQCCHRVSNGISSSCSSSYSIFDYDTDIM